MSVIELIDSAVAAGEDAMRWRPPEQRDAEIERLRTTMTSFGSFMSFAEEFAEGIRKVAKSLSAIRAAFPDDERAVRLRRMHAAYHRRRR